MSIIFEELAPTSLSVEERMRIIADQFQVESQYALDEGDFEQARVCAEAAQAIDRSRADAARWKMVEQALIDWRDAENYPASRYGTTPSPAQETAVENMVRAVEEALRTLRVEAEARR